MTQELFRVVTRLAVGAPVAAFPVPVAPTAPEPFVPDGSTPANVSTVLKPSLVVNARQTSAVPNCTFVRFTSVQVKLAPVTPVTVVFVPEDGPSVAMKASSNSLLDVVENVAEVIEVALEELSLNTSASRVSMPEPVAGVTVNVPVRVVPTG